MLTPPSIAFAIDGVMRMNKAFNWMIALTILGWVAIIFIMVKYASQ